MRRLTAIILFVSLLATAVAPLSAGRWQCPDGTLCHYTPNDGFRCQVRLSEAQKNLSPCCRNKQKPASHRCPHGLLPVAASVLSSTLPRLTAADDSCRCQFVPSPSSRSLAVASAVSEPMTVPAAVLPNVDPFSFSSQNFTLPHEDLFPRAREGPTPHVGRAPPLT